MNKYNNKVDMTEDLRSCVLMCKSTLNVVSKENKDKIWDNLKDMEGREIGIPISIKNFQEGENRDNKRKKKTKI